MDKFTQYVQEFFINKIEHKQSSNEIPDIKYFTVYNKQFACANVNLS